MKNTNKSLKEWNAIIEALGQGKQSILIRSYPTSFEGFLLYPTVSYTLRNNFFESFKEEYKPFVEKNAIPFTKSDKTEIKYYAKVEKVLKKSSSQISRLNKYHIWHKDHVKKYLKGKNGFVWILRIFKIQTPYMAEINRGMRYSNLKKEIHLSNAQSVLDDMHFLNILNNI